MSLRAQRSNLNPLRNRTVEVVRHLAPYRRTLYCYLATSCFLCTFLIMTSCNANCFQELVRHFYERNFLERLFEKRHFFSLPSEYNGQGKEISQWAMGASSERRVCEGRATKRSDWHGLCRPEPLRLDGNGMSVREANEATKVARTSFLPRDACARSNTGIPARDPGDLPVSLMGVSPICSSIIGRSSFLFRQIP